MPYNIEAAVHQAQLLAGIQGDLLEQEDIRERTGKLALLSDQLREILHQIGKNLDS